MIANAWFMPRHLLSKSKKEDTTISHAVTLSAEGETP
jgi:hypothetical protein